MATRNLSSSAIWMWKVNLNDPWYIPREDEAHNRSWTPYSDDEAALIEEKFQEKAKAAIFNDYRIDFKHFMHISNWDDKRERMVKRIEPDKPLQIPQAVQLRNERFSLVSLPLTRSFVRSNDADLSYFFFASYKPFQCSFPSPEDPDGLRMLVEKAAEGLRIEGFKEGQAMAQELLDVKDGTLQEVTQKCANLYTRNGFLYNNLNAFLRFDGDRTTLPLLRKKSENLGPFALLLSAMSQAGSQEKMTVYRSLLLDDHVIEQYREAEWNMEFLFSAFTSTTLNQEVAKLYGGNTILMIDIIPLYDGVDVSAYSQFPDEEEMLLNPYFCFRIRSCTYDMDMNKWIMHLQSNRVHDAEWLVVNYSQ